MNFVLILFVMETLSETVKHVFVGATQHTEKHFLMSYPSPTHKHTKNI